MNYLHFKTLVKVLFLLVVFSNTLYSQQENNLTHKEVSNTIHSILKENCEKNYYHLDIDTKRKLFTGRYLVELPPPLPTYKHQEEVFPLDDVVELVAFEFEERFKIHIVLNSYSAVISDSEKSNIPFKEIGKNDEVIITFSKNQFSKEEVIELLQLLHSLFKQSGSNVIILN